MAQYFGDTEIKADKISSPTGASTLDIAGRRLINVGNATVFNVMDYGALGDGSTNDITAIQNAINAAHAAIGGIVYFPLEVTYVINNVLTLYSNITIRGVSRGCTIFLKNASNSNMLEASAAGGYSDITIENITIDGNAANQSGGGTGTALIRITGSDTLLKNIRIQNCTIQNSYKHAINMGGDNTANRYPKWVVNNYIFNHGPSSIGYAIYTDYCPNTTIEGNTIKQSNGNDAIEMGHLGEQICRGNYLVDGKIQFPFASNSIIANNILDADTIQNDANTADNMVITGNQLKNIAPAVGYAGISVNGNNATITGNYVKVSQNSGIRLFGATTGGVISDNFIDGTSSGVSNNGIYPDHSNDVVMSNNNIQNFAKGVQIVYDNNTFSNNKVVNCTIGAALSNTSGSGHTIVNAQVLTNDFIGATTNFDPQNQTSYTYTQASASFTVAGSVKQTLFNVLDYGAVGDANSTLDGAINISTSANTLNSATAAFTTADVGKKIAIFGAGAAGVVLSTTIAAYISATQVTLTANASTTVSSTSIVYGTDNKTPFTNAVAAMTNGGTLYIPNGEYMVLGHTVVNHPAINIRGDGIGATTVTCGYNGSPGSENVSFGIFAFFDANTPISNCSIKDLSINLNQWATIGVHWKATSANSLTANNFIIDNVEFYNRGVDNTGSTACVEIKGAYSNLTGSLFGLRIKNCTFRDGFSTDSTHTTASSIQFQSDNISDVQILNNRFMNVYGNTIITPVNSATPRLRKNWLIQGNYFYNTVGNETNNYFGNALGDFVDSTRQGFDGIKFIDNHFESIAGNWTQDGINQDPQYYNIEVYQCYGCITKGNTFMNGCVVMAPGFDTNSTNNFEASEQHTRAYLFSNNTIFNYLSLLDPDGHIGGTYSDNVFWGVKKGGLLGGYGHHYPCTFDNNIFVNCGLKCQTDASTEFFYGIFGVEDGGNVIQNNLIYNDPIFSNPTAPTVATNGAGVLTGIYTYKVTFVSDTDYESAGGTTTSPITVSSQQIKLTNIPLGPIGCQGRKIYRTVAGGTDGTQRYVGRVDNNTGTTFSDNNSDGVLTSNVVPTINQTDSNLKHVFTELSAGGDTGNPNVYKNNTIIGGYSFTSTFYLDSGYKHIIMGNTGVTESNIQNSLASGSASVSPLAASDITANNFQTNGTPVINAEIMYTPYVAKTSTYGILVTDTIIDCTSGTFTATLPTAVGIVGQQFTIKNSGAGTITIATTSGQTIDGASTQTLSVQYSKLTCVSDGANWKTI